jgi:hypothetical protein
MLQITLYMLLKVSCTWLGSDRICSIWLGPYTLMAEMNNIAEDYRIKALPGVADLVNMTQYAG